MKTTIVTLILLAFLQTSVFPLNFCLLVILVRSFIRQDRSNLYLSLGVGLLLSLLQQLPLGLLSLTFCLMVEIIYLFKKTGFSESIWTIIPVVGVWLVVVDLLIGTALFPKIILEVTLILPVYLLVRFWEERFIVRPEIKLRI